MKPADELERIKLELEQYGVFVEPLGSKATYVIQGTDLPAELLLRLRTLKTELKGDAGEDLRIEVIEKPKDDEEPLPLVSSLFDGGRF